MYWEKEEQTHFYIVSQIHYPPASQAEVKQSGFKGESEFIKFLVCVVLVFGLFFFSYDLSSVKNGA